MTKRSTATQTQKKASGQQCRRRISTSPRPCCESLRQQHPNNSKQHGALAKMGNIFFSSSMADVALRLGPYMRISSKNAICTRTEKARKCRQITTNHPSHRPARRPANPPARLAFRQRKQQTRHTKRGKSPNKNTHKKICHRTQWSDHCITLKNMHTMN